MQPVQPTPPVNPRPGCTAIAWVIFLVIAAFLTFFGYKVFHYAKAIRGGGTVQLPQFRSKFTAAGTGAATASADRAIVETKNNPTLGNDLAPLTIVEFADFECPYSKEEALTVRRLMAAYGDRVHFIFRDFPVEQLHPGAMQTAVAAECAREQDKFWPYHDKLFGATAPFSLETLLRFGKEVGLETAQFERCIAEDRYAATVQADLDTAKGLGLRGTPTFFFNGQKIEGAIPEDIFAQLIERLSKESS